MNEPLIRSRYLLYRVDEGDGAYNYMYDDSTLAICEEELKHLFPAAEDKVYVTFSNRPITDIEVSDKFKVVPNASFGPTLEYNGFQYGYLYKWLRNEIVTHMDENGFVYIGVENYINICDKCCLARDNDGFCKYGCDDNA